jgi:hypothetical protein
LSRQFIKPCTTEPAGENVKNIVLSSTLVKMAQANEKALKTFVIGETGGDVPVALSKSASQEVDGLLAIESKRTWRSYVWSSRLQAILLANVV